MKGQPNPTLLHWITKAVPDTRQLEIPDLLAMRPHELLACVELALYVGILGPVTFCTFYYLFKRQTAWLYLQAFATGKNFLILLYHTKQSLTMISKNCRSCTPNIPVSKFIDIRRRSDSCPDSISDCSRSPYVRYTLVHQHFFNNKRQKDRACILSACPLKWLECFITYTSSCPPYHYGWPSDGHYWWH